MPDAALPENQPPKLRRTETGEIETASLADTLEWFLNFDERTARMRHANTDEIFRWKQADDAEQGIGTYPFENAESRFAVGVFQALAENDSEPMLKLCISDVLNALHESRETKAEITEAYSLDANAEMFAMQKAELLTTTSEKRLYLSSCWLEALCTAEARVLGWVYQEIYGKPFS
jgi:hypothetical protein